MGAINIAHVNLPGATPKVFYLTLSAASVHDYLSPIRPFKDSHMIIMIPYKRTSRLGLLK
jgi:hypothetical protein